VLHEDDVRHCSRDIDDPVEERESKEVEGGTGSEDGGSVELSRSIEEEVGENFSKGVFVEGEKSDRSHI